MRAALVLLLLTSSLCAKDAPKASCKSGHIAIHLREGQNFQHELGEGFVFKITFEQQAGEASDWWITVENAKDQRGDYMWPVNGPMHFNSLQYYGTVFGETVRDRIPPKSVDFLLSQKDFDTITKLRSEAQWPAPGYDEQKGYANFMHAVEHARTGNVHLVAKHFRKNIKGQLASLDLDATFTLPGDFKLAEADSKPTQCIRPWVLETK
jgi:hypothetical protein